MPKNETRPSLDWWPLLRFGDVQEGLALVRDAYLHDASASSIMELGVAYLWTKQYDSAQAHFSRAMAEYQAGTMSSFYEMLGVAEWCRGRNAAAVQDWQSGLDAEFSDAAGLGVTLPLLLFAASILSPGLVSRQEAVRVLREKARDPRANCWSGIMARFVLGQETSENAIDRSSIRVEAEKLHREWLLGYYGDLLDFDRRRLSPPQYAESMRRATDTSQPQFSDQDYFLLLMWSAEFFLARHAADSGQRLIGSRP